MRVNVIVTVIVVVAVAMASVTVTRRLWENCSRMAGRTGQERCTYSGIRRALLELIVILLVVIDILGVGSLT